MRLSEGRVALANLRLRMVVLGDEMIRDTNFEAILSRPHPKG
mgnify:FL=1